MKFTKEEAFEKLKGFLTNNGKKSLRMSERSINKQLELLMPLIANEETDLDDFIGKVKDTFSVMNSNVEKDNSDFVKQWEKDHPTDKPIDKSAKPDNDTPDDATSALLKRIEELEKKEQARSKEAVLSQKKEDLLKAMKEKGIKDEQWSKSFISEIAITEDMDVEAKADTFLKIYNKSQAGQTGNGSTPFGSSSGGDNNKKDPLEAVRKLMEQRSKEREELSNINKKE